MNSYEDDFGPYLEGEDKIACTYDTVDEFVAAIGKAMRKE